MASISAHTPTAPWPPDDTEASIVGVDRHQLDILSLRTGINEEAHRRAGGGPLPWQAISQIMPLGGRRPDGSAYTVYPDGMVFPRRMAIDRGSYSLRQGGPPALIAEVASEATYQVDLDAAGGKPWSYARAGVTGYLVLDPTGALAPELGRGWRLADGVAHPWAPDQDGRWRSKAIPIAVGVTDRPAAVYGADGRRHVREGEVDAAVRAQRAADLRRGLAGMVLLKFGEAGRPLLRALTTVDDPAALEVALDRLPSLAAPDDVRALPRIGPGSAVN